MQMPGAQSGQVNPGLSLQQQNQARMMHAKSAAGIPPSSFQGGPIQRPINPSSGQGGLPPSFSPSALSPSPSQLNPGLGFVSASHTPPIGAVGTTQFPMGQPGIIYQNLQQQQQQQQQPQGGIMPQQQQHSQNVRAGMSPSPFNGPSAPIGNIGPMSPPAMMPPHMGSIPGGGLGPQAAQRRLGPSVSNPGIPINVPNGVPPSNGAPGMVK
jgi:hypothetical protein